MSKFESSPEKRPQESANNGQTDEHPVLELFHVGERILSRTGEYLVETEEDVAHLARVAGRCIPEYSREATLEIKRILGKAVDKEW